MIASPEYKAWSDKVKAKREAPTPFTFRETFQRYCVVATRWVPAITLQQLCRLPDIFAHAERSGSEGCYVEVARWSYLRERWEKICHCKCFGGEIKEHPDLSDNDTAKFIADFLNSRHNGHNLPIVYGFKTFNFPEKPNPDVTAILEAILEIAQNCKHGVAPLVARQTFGSPINEIARLAAEALASHEGSKAA